VEAALQTTVNKLKSLQAEYRAAAAKWDEERQLHENEASVAKESYEKALDAAKNSTECANRTCGLFVSPFRELTCVWIPLQERYTT
jgi:hypothetical protein